MAAFTRLPFILRWLALGLAILAVTLAVVTLWIAAFSEPFGDWDWPILTFVLVIAETLILGAIAVANGPYEGRFKRWTPDDFTYDAYATLFRMDLDAQEQVPPRRVFIDTRFILMAIPVALATLVIGLSLARGGEADERVPITDLHAIEIAEKSVKALASRTQVPVFRDISDTTVAEAQTLYPGDDEIAALPQDRQILLVSFNLAKVDQPSPVLLPGPAVLVDALNGQVLAITRVR
jgi:hypothetical protein